MYARGTYQYWSLFEEENMLGMQSLAVGKEAIESFLSWKSALMTPRKEIILMEV